MFIEMFPLDGASVYDFTLPDLHQSENVSLSQYAGKVLLIVNVASFWGATQQYLSLNALQDRYERLEVIGVPCNQFGKVSGKGHLMKATYKVPYLGKN